MQSVIRGSLFGSSTARLLAACIALAGILAAGIGNSAEDDTGARVPETLAPPFPAGYDWPADPKLLNAAIEKGDWKTLRQHAWWLWAGMNKTNPDQTPLWWAWPTSTAAFSSGARLTLGSAAPRARSLKAANAANSPIETKSPKYFPPVVRGAVCQSGTIDTQLPDGNQFQNNGDIMLAGVIYNQDAYGWIRRERLYQGAKLSSQLNAGKKDIAPFPARSFALKHMYWPARGDGVTALPVWHPEKYPLEPDKYIGYEVWQDTVAIDPSQNVIPPGKTVPVSYLYHILNHDKTVMPTVQREARVVSIRDFYHRRIGADELGKMDRRDRDLLNASACWLFNRPFRAGDYLVSIAMHINSKEIPGWALQSVWWSDTPDEGEFAADRPAISRSKAPGPWRHYLMTLDYGIEQPKGELPVAYNPYIELASHPVQTSCRNCHMRAAWPRAGFPGIAPAAPTASYQAASGPGPLVALDPDDPVFKGLMRLDFQWGMSDRALAPPK
jgi:hypothetical protein